MKEREEVPLPLSAKSSSTEEIITEIVTKELVTESDVDDIACEKKMEDIVSSESASEDDILKEVKICES